MLNNLIYRELWCFLSGHLIFFYVYFDSKTVYDNYHIPVVHRSWVISKTELGLLFQHNCISNSFCYIWHYLLIRYLNKLSVASLLMISLCGNWIPVFLSSTAFKTNHRIFSRAKIHPFITKTMTNTFQKWTSVTFQLSKDFQIFYQRQMV